MTGYFTSFDRASSYRRREDCSRSRRRSRSHRCSRSRRRYYCW